MNITDSAQELDSYDVAIMVDGELVTVDARTLSQEKLRALLAEAPDREEGDFYRHLLGAPPARVALGECVSVDELFDTLRGEGHTTDDIQSAYDSLVASGLDSDAWYDSWNMVQYVSESDLDVVREQLDSTTTYTATVTENPTDWAEIFVLITDDSDQDSGVVGVDFRTRAYDDPAGKFDADSYNEDTLKEEVFNKLEQLGWRPVMETWFVGGDEKVTLTVEKVQV